LTEIAFLKYLNNEEIKGILNLKVEGKWTSRQTLKLKKATSVIAKCRLIRYRTLKDENFMVMLKVA
jgi:6-phosphogluconate dehydrogenase (decarboxylating)